LSPHSLRFLNRHQQKKRKTKEHLNDFDIYNQERKKLLEQKGKVSSKSRSKKSREEYPIPRKAVKRAREEDLEASEASSFNVTSKKACVELKKVVGDADARLVEVVKMNVFMTGESKSLDEKAKSKKIASAQDPNVLPAATATASPMTDTMATDEIKREKGKKGKKAPQSMVVDYDDPFNTHCEPMDVKRSYALDLNYDKLLNTDDLGDFYTLALSKVGNLYKPVQFNRTIPTPVSFPIMSSPQVSAEPMDVDKVNAYNGESSAVYDDMDCDYHADSNDDDGAADYEYDASMKMESGAYNAVSSFGSIYDDMDLTISPPIFSFH